MTDSLGSNGMKYAARSTNLYTPGLLIAGAGVILLPLAVVLITSFKPAGSSSNSPGWSLENYREAWERGQFLLAFANSVFVAIVVTLFQLFTSALAGYALARLKFQGKQALLLIVLATLVIPFQILVIPIFLVLKWGHLINTYAALILPTAANGFGIFLMRQYFQGIPIELEEAAILDGADRAQILWRITLPLSRPALVTLALFTFIAEWNDLFKPLVFTTRPELRTVQLALASFQEQFTNSWALLMAAIVLATVPILIIFAVGQRQLIQGIATTGIKN